MPETGPFLKWPFFRRRAEIVNGLCGEISKNGGLEKVLFFRSLETGAGELYEISPGTLRDLFIERNYKSRGDRTSQATPHG